MPIPSPRSTHTPTPEELKLPQTLHKERHLMENVSVPIVTISATFQGAFPEFKGKRQEIVYSRAHYSQAMACLIAAGRLNKSAWLIDPSNYVSAKDWPKVVLTEKVAEIFARAKFLKTIKTLLDSKAGGKLPIAGAIKDPLAYATARTQKPILSVHYATSNILAQAGKKILGIVTDPYVRPSYLQFAHLDNIFFTVFDPLTKKEFISKASHFPNFTKKSLTSLKKRLFVTGPPVDPRILDIRKTKSPKNLDQRPLRLTITTGGVGTNKSEIAALLDSLAPRLTGPETTLQLIAYAGTHQDFINLYQSFAQKHSIPIGPTSQNSARLRIISAPHLMEANEKLIKHVFPWTDAIITKPSGDMAYDTVASGSALLLLSPIGQWEERIRDIFLQKNCAVTLDPENFGTQLTKLETPQDKKPSPLQTLIQNSLDIDSLYLNGAKNIIKTLLSLS